MSKISSEKADTDLENCPGCIKHFIKINLELLVNLADCLKNQNHVRLSVKVRNDWGLMQPGMGF